MSNIIDSIQLSGSSYDVRDKSATTVVEITQSDYDNLPSSAKTSNILYIITDGSVDYITSAQCQTQINNSISGKQDTLIAGTGISIVDNVISATGGSDINIVQTTGTSTTDVMSQDAVTTVINTLSGAIPSTYVSTISKDSVIGWLRFARFSTPSNFNYFILDNPKINGTPIHKFTGVESQINQFSLVETSAITTSITSSSTDVQVPSAKAVNDKLGGLSIVKLTQAQYDALATKDNSTLYVIVN